VSLLKSPQGRERLVIFVGQPYRRGHGVDSVRRCFALRFPFSQPRFAGNWADRRASSAGRAAATAARPSCSN